MLDHLGPLDKARISLQNVLKEAFAELDKYKDFDKLRGSLEDYFIFCGRVSKSSTSDSYLAIVGENALKFSDTMVFVSNMISSNARDKEVAAENSRVEIEEFTAKVKSGFYTEPVLIASGYLQIDDDYFAVRDRCFKENRLFGEAEDLARKVYEEVKVFLGKMLELSISSSKHA